MANKNELFRATLGFDFIFYKKDGVKYPICIEINGEESGLKIPEGEIEDVLKEKIKTRMTYTPQRVERSKYAESLNPVTQSEEVKQAWAHARSVPAFIHAFQNPDFIKEAIKSKESQEQFIPKEYRPRFYHKGDTSISSTYFWICKPKIGRKGKDIKIFNNTQFENQFLGTELENTYIAQEFIPALSADNASSKMKNNPASMRLLMDFRYLKDNIIDEVFTFALQRISPYSTEQSNIESLEDIYIVNGARGARSIKASENEFNLARNVALRIIKNLARGFKN